MQFYIGYGIILREQALEDRYESKRNRLYPIRIQKNQCQQPPWSGTFGLGAGADFLVERYGEEDLAEENGIRVNDDGMLIVTLAPKVKEN